MDYTQMTAPYGLDCFNCALYRANDNEKIRKVVAEKIKCLYKTRCTKLVGQRAE